MRSLTVFSCFPLIILLFLILFKGVMTIVMVGQNDVGAWDILRDAADVALSLEQDVLPATASTSRTTADTSPVSSESMSSPAKAATSTTSFSNGSISSENQMVLDLCRLVRNAQVAQEASPDNPYTDEWVDFGSVASHLQQIVSKSDNTSTSENVKEITKDIRKQAESKGFVQVGRRIINTGNSNKDRNSPSSKRKIVASFKNPKFSYSTEVYIRLLPAGMTALMEQEQRKGSSSSPSSSSSPNKTATGSPIFSKKSCCVYFRQLPLNIRVIDLVQFVEETYSVTVLRALLESPGQNARSCHVEFTHPDHATLMLQKAKKTGGGEGMIFQGRYIGVVPNSRSSALNKKGNEVVYYERMASSTAVPNNKPSGNTFHKNDTYRSNDKNNYSDSANDTALLCQSILDLDSSSSSSQQQHQAGSNDAWIGGGAVGQFFRVKLPNHVLETLTKEEISMRFRTARDTAIMNGLVEMGRRKMDSVVTTTTSSASGTTTNTSSTTDDYTYVVVPLMPTKPYSSANAALDATAKLSKETYLRLLPEGRELALSTKQEPSSLVAANGNDESSTSKEKNLADNMKSSTVRQCVFLNNVADSTGSTQLAEFFETTVENIQVDRIELEPSNWKGSVCLAAHVQFSNPQQAKAVLAYSKATGLIHRGRHLYAKPDRTTPDNVAEKEIERPTEMSYTRDLLAKMKKLEPIGKRNPFFLSAAHDNNGIFGNISFDGSNSIDSNDHAADLVTGLLGPSPSNTAEEPKDPFEDLLWP